MQQDKSQKTEKPTPRRKRESRKEGRVARSADIVPWFLVLIATFVLPLYISRVGQVLSNRFAVLGSVNGNVTPQFAVAQTKGAMNDILTLTVPVLLVSAVVAVVLSLAQTGFVLTLKPLTPKFERINPLTGLKRLFSPRGMWEGLKATMRMAAVAAVAVPIVISVDSKLAGRPLSSLDWSIGLVGAQLLNLARKVALLGLLISAADFAIQRRNLIRDLRMTKEEIKQENKQAEGDPHLKSHIRQTAQAMSRNRMLGNVSDATAIVVNPTHFAVAIRYDAQVGVPTVVAKGAGDAALRIRSEGLSHSIPTVECKPLARALFRTCEVGTVVPRELFQGVAVLLAFVHKLGNRRTLGGVQTMDSDTSRLGLDNLEALTT